MWPVGGCFLWGFLLLFVVEIFPKVFSAGIFLNFRSGLINVLVNKIKTFPKARLLGKKRSTPERSPGETYGDKLYIPPFRGHFSCFP